MRELTLLLKPASGQCNARCAYCFYQDVTQKRNQASCGMMTVATLEIILRKALRQAEKGCTITVSYTHLDVYKRQIQVLRMKPTLLLGIIPRMVLKGYTAFPLM